MPRLVLSRKVISTLALLAFSSCSPLTQTTQQESEDFLSLVSNSRLNSGNDIVHAVVLQWTPSAIHAIAGYRARQQHWTQKEKDEYERDLVTEHYGDYGDSTTFLISLTNSQYPCQSPLLVLPQKTVSLIPQSMMPCSDIPIDSIHNKIYLQNERGVQLHAIFVSGRRNGNLTTEELLWAKFQIGLGGFNWMSSSQEIYLMIDIKPQLIKLRIK